MADGSGMAVLAHDADDCNSDSDRHRRQRRRFIGMPSASF
jgi:hypothetical protein